MKKTIDLHDTQYTVWDDNHRFKVICAGRRWGKSTLAIASALTVMGEKPGAIVVIVAPTYQQAKDIYWRDPLKLPTMIPQDFIKKKNDSELYLQLKNGSYLYLRGSDRPDTLRGMRFDYAVLDEYAQMKPNVWEEIIQPALLDSKGSAMFISTPYGYDKFYKLWLLGQTEKSKDGKENDWKSWRFTSYDNPKNDPADLNKWKADYDDDTFAQEFLAEFKKLKGLVYKDFDRSVHVIPPKEIPLYWPHYRAIDFGFVNPTAILFAAISPDNEIFIYDQIYQSGLKTPEIADLIKQRSVGKTFVNTIADSAQSSDIAELQKYGLGIYPVSKTSGNRDEDWTTFRVRKISEKLRQKKLFILNTCKDIIFEFEHYKYQEIREEKNIREVPLKLNDHALDALSYLVVSLPEKIEPTSWDWQDASLLSDDKDWSFT